MIYRFDLYSLDTDCYELRKGDKPVAVEPQVFNLLAYLIAHRDRVVTRAELFEELWKDRVVTDAVLGARLKDARRAVGDSGNRQAVIKTSHGRGYQFVAAVVENANFEEPVDSLPSEEGRPSVAVLPFSNLSADAAQDYFSDGITEDIITELSRFRSLFVIARNSAFIFREQGLAVSDIAAKLGVQYIVEGSLRKSSERVRINVQLIEADSGRHLWAERYDREPGDVFTVLDEVVAIIAGRIPGTLERLGVDIARRRPPRNMTAFDLTLRGRWSLHHSNEGTRAAIGYLQQALESDRSFARAHAHLAYAYAFSVFTDGDDPDSVAQRVQQHAIRAVTLDDKDPDVHAVAAIAFLLSGAYERADAHSQLAFESNPNDYMALYSRALVLAYLGRAGQALPYFEQMERIDPYAPDDLRADGFCDCLFFLGDYEKMLAIYQRWANLPPHLYLVRAAALAALDRIEEARASVGEFIQLEQDKPDPAVFVKSQMRMVAQQRDRDRWLDAYRQAGISV